MKLIHDRIVIDYRSLLDEYNLSRNTINDGLKRFRNGETASWENIKENNQVFIYIDRLPVSTRKKLPSEEVLKGLLVSEQKNKQINSIYKKLKYAQENTFSDYQKHYRSAYGMNTEDSFKIALKRAVWERLMSIHSENCTGNKGGLKKGVLTALYAAYNQLYTGNYTSEQAFSRAIKSVQMHGFDSICVDKRAFSSQRNQRFDERHEYFLRVVFSEGKAYQAPKMHQRLAEMCKEAGIDCPSLSWVKHNKQLLSHQERLHNARYGADPTDKIQAYAGITPAMHADSQYQIDGWDLPFYYLGKDANGSNRLKKLTLIAVKDAQSRKIVGYSIGRSENRLTLLDAIQDAVTNTGAMPFELVSDNHSYNKTMEIEHFKAEIEKIGTTWTVDSNPKRKAIAERGFKDMGERFCKDHYGYIGQGIRTKQKDGRTKQELIDKYQKSGSILSKNEIKMIAISVVKQYNETKLPNKDKSPDQLYNESAKPQRIEVDEYDRLRLFTKKTEYKVSRHQINIVIAGHKYEYQLPARFAKYNGKKVVVRYDSPDLIYLFELKKDEPICTLKQKEKAHGALADQTPKDIEILNRFAARKKAVTINARKELEDLAARAAALDPAIFDIANRKSTPKDVLKQAEEDEVYRQMVIRQGINIREVTTVPKVSELELPELKSAKRSEREKSPFAVENNKMGVINLDEL